MKKHTYLLSSALILSLGLAACSNNTETKTEPKKEATATTNEAEKAPHEEEHTHNVDFKFGESTAKQNEKTSLNATLKLEKKPLKDADVRYQINYEDEEKADWIDLKEDKPGHYTTSYTFKNKGNYTLKLHVMKGSDLHEHEDNKITVK
ncbi:MAG: FixH family protein [Kurthia sp.]